MTNETRVSPVRKFRKLIDVDNSIPPEDRSIYQYDAASQQLKPNSVLSGKYAAAKLFSVRDYGAKGDGVRLSDAGIAAGSVTLTSATAVFVAADVGKTILVAGAGAAGADLVTTIATRVSPTQVTLNVAATTLVVGGIAVYGTDDTAAIQAAINAAYAAGGGVVYVPEGIYIVAGVPYTGGTNPNAQIYLPARDFLPTTPQIPIALVGPTPPCTATGAGGGHPPLLRGATFYSVLTGTATTYAALLGGNGGPGYVLPNFTNIQFEVRDVSFVVRYVKCAAYNGPFAHAVHLGQVSSASIDGLSIFVDVPLDQTVAPTDNFVSGLIMPGNNNAAWSKADNVLVAGFPIGVSAGEHGVFGLVNVMCCRQGVYFPAVNHASRFFRVGAFWCKYGLYFAGDHFVEIGQLAIEHIADPTKWYNSVNDVDDAANHAKGSVRYHVVTSGVGSDDGGFRFNGALSLCMTPSSGAASHLESTLGATFDLHATASNTWVDTGVEITVPSAGSYEFSGVIRFAFASPTQYAYLEARLYDATNAFVIPNSETLLAVATQAGVGYAGTVPILPMLYRATTSLTVRLQVKQDSGASYTQSEIDSDAAGRTRMIAKGIAA